MQRRQFLQAAAATFAVNVVAGGFLDIANAAEDAAVAHVDGALDAAAFNAARRFANTPMGKIAYVEQGNGEAALFLHGFPLNSFQWRGALERLSPCRRCVAPDFLGLGYTEVAKDQGLAPKDQVDMLAALLDELSIASVDLIANDSGGAVAQLFVAEHPQRVRTLLLTNCDSEIECPPAALRPVLDLAKEGKFVEKMISPLLADKTLARSREALGSVFTYTDNPTDEAVDMYLGPLARSPDRTNTYALALESNSLAGIGPALADSKAPVRIIWGTGDTIFSAAGAEHLDRAFSNSRGIRYIEGAKLFFPEEFPDVIAEEARRLWASS